MSALTIFRRAFVPAILLLLSTTGARSFENARESAWTDRDHWGIEQGFPAGPIYAIAQTPDGYLWIGTEKGLVRFDGQGFRLNENTITDQTGPVLGLTLDRHGDLWARLRRPTLLRFRDGRFDKPLASISKAGSVVATSRTNEGDLLLWVLDGEPAALSFDGQKLKKLSVPQFFSRSPVLALSQLPNGEIWVGTRDAGLFRLHGDNSSAVRYGLPDPKVNCLFLAENGTLWIGTDAGLAQWNGRELTTAGIPPVLRDTRILALSGDRQSNLWVGTNNRGLIRIDRQGGVATEEPSRVHDAITALFEDREGSIWVGRASGLERIRLSAFLTLRGTRDLQPGPVYADPFGGIWSASVKGGLRWLSHGRIAPVVREGLDADIIHSITGHGNDLWIGRQSGRITHLQFKGTAITSASTWGSSEGLPGSGVSVVHRTRNGAIWAGTIGGGAGRLEGNRFDMQMSKPGLASNVVTSIADTSDGSTWFGTPRGLSSFSRGTWRTYSTSEGLPSQNIYCLFADASDVLWIGTASGLARWRQNSIAPVHALDGYAIAGIAEDERGWLWLAAAGRVLKVDRRSLLDQSVTAEDIREYGPSDGLHGVEAVRRHRSVVAGPTGLIYFSSSQGLSVADPGRLLDAVPPAIADIQAVVADGEPMKIGSNVVVPPGRRRIRISYAGLSLSFPERVRFRYRLDNFDAGWSEPVASREAIYTNLPPGNYRFHLMASNPDGIWNGTEATIGLSVEPALWQTPWFRLVVVVSAFAGLAILYRRRMSELSRQLNIRFEERLAERTRIAQDLHDTLLQGFLSASMQLDVAAEKLSDDSPAKPQIHHVLDLMRRVTDEGRNAVRGLRSSNIDSSELEGAFLRVQQEFARPDVSFRVTSTGTQRPLHPVLRDEVYRIGREALVNAFKHSGASSIEADVEYSPRQLRISIRDNGCGIDEKVLKTGRDGHWGLSGMRERAERVGARFQVWSSSQTGTEVDLRVPGHVAFEVDGSRPGFAAWISRLYRWKTPTAGRTS